MKAKKIIIIKKKLLIIINNYNKIIAFVYSHLQIKILIKV